MIPDEAEQVLAVHEGLQALSAIHEQEASIVELRFFGGFTHQEIAEIIRRLPLALLCPFLGHGL